MIIYDQLKQLFPTIPSARQTQVRYLLSKGIDQADLDEALARLHVVKPINLILYVLEGTPPPPLCEVCGSNGAIWQRDKFARWCSVQCRNKHPEMRAAVANRDEDARVEKMKSTLQERYGVSSPFQLESSNKKREEAQAAKRKPQKSKVVSVKLQLDEIDYSKFLELSNGVFIDNKSCRKYFDLLTTSVQNENGDYRETHHILPRSLFSQYATKNKWNTVKLSVENHIIAHYHLVNCCANEQIRVKMLRGLWLIASGIDQRSKFAHHRLTAIKVVKSMQLENYTQIMEEAEATIWWLKKK